MTLTDHLNEHRMGWCMDGHHGDCPGVVVGEQTRKKYHCPCKSAGHRAGTHEIMDAVEKAQPAVEEMLDEEERRGHDQLGDGSGHGSSDAEEGSSLGSVDDLAAMRLRVDQSVAADRDAGDQEVLD